MQGLIETIVQVQRSLPTHGPLFANSELQTRYGLIDPILRALGWDTGNLDELQVDYAAGNGRADYVIFFNNKPHVVIEAKALGLLSSNTPRQANAYCRHLGAAYFVCTDGDIWEVYRYASQGGSLLARWQISKMAPADVARYAKCLEKPPIVPAVPSIFAPSSPLSPTPPPPPSNSISLDQLYKQLQHTRKLAFSYSRLHFPGSNAPVSVGSYVDILRKVVRYLNNAGLIPAPGVPSIVVPIGTGSLNPRYYTRVGSWDVLTHGNAARVVGFAVQVLNHCGINPSTVYVS